MRRGRLLFVLAVVGASLGWVAAKGLSGNLVYYLTPTELLKQGSSAVGDRVRLGGLVQPGSVERSGSTVRFVVTDGTTRMTVVDTGGVPSLFRDGRGVVLEGAYGRAVALLGEYPDDPNVRETFEILVRALRRLHRHAGT